MISVLYIYNKIYRIWNIESSDYNALLPAMDIYIIGPHLHMKTHHSYLVVAGSNGPYVSHYRHSYKYLVMLMMSLGLKMLSTDTLVPRILVSNGEPP